MRAPKDGSLRVFERHAIDFGGGELDAEGTDDILAEFFGFCWHRIDLTLDSHRHKGKNTHELIVLPACSAGSTGRSGNAAKPLARSACFGLSAA